MRLAKRAQPVENLVCLLVCGSVCAVGPGKWGLVLGRKIVEHGEALFQLEHVRKNATKSLLIGDVEITELRDAVDRAAAATVEEQRRLWRADEDAAIAKLTEAGMLFNDVDAAPFAERVKGLYEEYYGKYGADFRRLCEQIKATE